jgi:myo-inositol-1(or 4)-monophosphatase
MTFEGQNQKKDIFVMALPIEIAEAAAREGGRRLIELFGKTSAEQKGSTYNLVTVADREAEEIIVDVIDHAMPGCSFLGEEAHRAALNAERLWIIDPLDGTTNFSHSVPHFGVSVAYAEHGEIKAGVVYDPMRDELFSATEGAGAFLNGKRIEVSGRKTLSESLIGTGFYYDRGELMEKTLRALHHLFKEQIHCMRRNGAASLDMTWLASGRLDGYFEYQLSPWDFAAGLLILHEAGGVASDPSGQPANLFSKGLICSNGLIHEELLGSVLNPEKT